MSKASYLPSKSPAKTNAIASFRFILVENCLVSGWDMNEDKRFGAIWRTRHLHTLLFLGGIIKTLNDITSSSFSFSPYVIRDLTIVNWEVYYIIGHLGCLLYECLHKFYHFVHEWVHWAATQSQRLHRILVCLTYGLHHANTCPLR